MEKQNCQKVRLSWAKKKNPAHFQVQNCQVLQMQKLFAIFCLFFKGPVSRQTSICNKECEQSNVIKKATETKEEMQKIVIYVHSFVHRYIYTQNGHNVLSGGCPL